MDSFPNMPPPPKRAKFSGPPVGVKKASAEPATTPVRKTEPAQIPMNYGTEKPAGDDAGEFLTDDQFIEHYVEQRNPFPAIVLGVGVALCYAIYAGFGAYSGGAAEALALAIMATAMLAVASMTASGVGWLVCKIFGDDIDSVVTHFLRFSSVAAYQLAVLTGLVLALGLVPALLLIIPVTVVIVVYLGGMDILRAVVFTAPLLVLDFALVSFFAVDVLSAALQPS